MFGWFKKKSEPKPDATKLVPRIKNGQFREAILAHGVPEDQMPIIEPLAADLVVTYAFDMGSGFMMTMPHHLPEAGLRRETLREVAVANMRRQIPNAHVGTADGLSQVKTGGHMEACALLSSNLWTSVAASMRGGVVAVVPTRDLLLFCDAGDAPARARMMTTAAVAFASEGTHALSLHALRWTGDGWTQAEPVA